MHHSDYTLKITDDDGDTLVIHFDTDPTCITVADHYDAAGVALTDEQIRNLITGLQAILDTRK